MRFRKNIKAKKIQAKTDFLAKPMQLSQFFVATVTILLAAAGAIGWLMRRAYFSEVGLEWGSDTLPTARFIQEAGFSIFSFLLVFIFLSAQLIQTKNRWPFEIFAGTLAVACAICYVFSVRIEIHLIEIAGIMSLATFFSTFFSRLHDKKCVKKNDYALVLMLIIPIAIFWCILMENQRAKIDMDSDTSNLPFVTKNGQPMYQWRIVDVIDNKALLVQLSVNPGERKFLSITLDDNWEISLREIKEDRKRRNGLHSVIF